MEWKGRRQSNNIEDRRGAGGRNPFGRGGMRIPVGRGGVRRAGGGLGIGSIILILIVSWVFGINPLTLLSGGDIGLDGGGYEQQQTRSTPANDEMTAFVRTVLAETEDTWNGIFQASGQTYEEPQLVLFS